MKKIGRLSTSTEPFKLSKSLYKKTKKNFEMVISRYDEDISWCKNYKNYITIYNKGEDIEYEHIKLENKGHLADTILRHIINNYKNLADVTFFTHGSFNYRKDQLIKESGSCHKRFEEFIRTDKDTLVYISRSDLPDKNNKFYNYDETVGEVYYNFFGEEYKKNFRWGCGKWISVSREKIQNTPLSTYKKMLQFVLKDYHNQEPSQHIYRSRGIYIERFILKCFI
tara:strand:- start:18917 stop:19591 length:675 start_codon:yes stop_codon:yes gene_type:complete